MSLFLHNFSLIRVNSPVRFYILVTASGFSLVSLSLQHARREDLSISPWNCLQSILSAVEGIKAYLPRLDSALYFLKSI